MKAKERIDQLERKLKHLHFALEEKRDQNIKLKQSNQQFCSSEKRQMRKIRDFAKNYGGIMVVLNGSAENSILKHFGVKK